MRLNILKPILYFLLLLVVFDIVLNMILSLIQNDPDFHFGFLYLFFILLDGSIKLFLSFGHICLVILGIFLTVLTLDDLNDAIWVSITIFLSIISKIISSFDSLVTVTIEGIILAIALKFVSLAGLSINLGGSGGGSNDSSNGGIIPPNVPGPIVNPGLEID